MPADRAAVTVSLSVTIVVPVTDDGYLGINETVNKHIQKARDEASGWKFLVQRGGTEPQQVQARVKVLSVNLVPKED